MATLIPYRKPYLSSSALCDKLTAQGLIIKNPKFAMQVLERCSYYRFKVYLSPFINETTRRFNKDVKFEDAYQLYRFDSALRSFVFDLIESVEIGVRSSFDQWVNDKTDNSFWYLDASLFVANGNYTTTVNKVRSSFVGSKEPFAEHFQSKYYNQYCPFYRDLPPAWVAIELMTFGNLTNLMKCLSATSIQNLKLDRYANKKLGIQKFKTLISWLVTLQGVRNQCCHHIRLFNRNMHSPTGIKRILDKNLELVEVKSKQGHKAESQLNRLYTALAALQQIYTSLGHEHKIGNDLIKLFDAYPVSKKFYTSMGFPKQWHQEPLFF
jgi:abortive infection bacteriophage resistance protein